MPYVSVEGVRIFYRLEGKAGQPVLVLSHSIGADHGLWSPQMEDLIPHFQILRFDTRGHGASDAPSGEYSLEMLGRDVLAVTRALGVDKFAFCGLSMGGAIGQWLAIHAGEHLTALVLANTSPQFGDPSNWQNRIKLVSEGGMAAVLEVAMARSFTPETAKAGDPGVSAFRSVLLGTNPVGYAGCCAALRDVDFRGELKKIMTPTLVIGGDRDLSTPWEGHGDRLAREIPGAKTVRLPAAHLSNLERPRSFTAALLEFLKPAADYGDPLEAGFAVRRAVLGDAHVDRSIAGANDLTRDFQTMITRYAWGTIWTRPGLSRRTRRLLTLAIAAATGRTEELRLHVRAGLEHELEPCDLKEVLMQTAIYAGVPAANTAFHIANEEMEKRQQGA